MAALTQDQITRILEFQQDFCDLVLADFQNPNFPEWYQAYEKYVVYGPNDTLNGGQRPPKRPPA